MKSADSVAGRHRSKIRETRRTCSVTADTPWLKIKNRDYTQALGRNDLFAPVEEPNPVVDSWDTYTIVCAEMDL